MWLIESTNQEVRTVHFNHQVDFYTKFQCHIPNVFVFQTEIGYARAWVRLALERKSLSEYLRVLVSDAGLLKGMYKRYGFLRYSNILLI